MYVAGTAGLTQPTNSNIAIWQRRAGPEGDAATGQVRPALSWRSTWA
jgi:hypothetical protein